MISLGLEVNDLDSENDTPLISACHAEDTNIELISLLLKMGANTDAVGYADNSPITIAVAENKLELAELLLNSGVNPNTTLKGYLAGHVSSTEMYNILEKHKNLFSEKHWESLIRRRLSLLSFH